MSEPTVATRRERKVITVVFVDLVGFTSRSEQLDPEDVEAFLGPYHELARGELERFGGTVEKFIGDAVVGIFGAPLSHEDDPERAVRAALAVRDAVRDRGELEIRVGIATGEAIVRIGADPASGEGLATGDVMNTASRLQSAAPVNGVVVSATTQQATRDVIRYEELQPVVAKGKADPVPAWLAVEARSRLGVDVRQASAVPLVGRERERSLLIDTLSRAEAESTPQLVTIVGVPGIGKSRLLYELFEEVERRPSLTTWRQGRSLPYGEGIAFWALAEMVKAQAGILEDDPVDAARDKLWGAVREVVPEPDAGRIAARLGGLLGLDPSDGAAEERQAVFGAWRAFLERLAERRTLVLAFEDLHWADEGLLDFIDHLVDWAADVPILVVCTARPELLERRPGWGGGKRNALTLALSPLSDAEAGQVLDGALAGSEVDPPMRQALLERASGNPLYAQQFARLCLERGPGGDLPLPDTVHGLIAARLDGLSADEKRLLQDAAVMGKVFWSGALQQDAAPVLLHGLQRKEFIRRERRASVAEQEEYAFTHVLVRDVAYGQIPRAERAAKHRRAAEWIEALGRPDDHAELVAHHYGTAASLVGAAADENLRARACRAHRVAGDRALSLFAPATAVEHFRAALGLAPDKPRERALLLLALGRAEERVSQSAAATLTEASAALEAVEELEGAAEAETILASVMREAGRDFGGHMDRAVALLADRPPSAAKAAALSLRSRYRAFAAASAEALRDALSESREALAMAEALGLDELRAQTLNTIGMVRHTSGDPTGNGIDELEAAVSIGRELDSMAEFRALNNLSVVQYDTGRLEDADRTSAAAYAAALRIGATERARWVQLSLPHYDYWRGDWDGCLRKIEQYLAEIDAGNPHWQEVSLRTTRIFIRVGRDDAEGAVADADRLVTLARRLGEPQALVPSLAVAIVATTASGDVDGARALCDELNAIRTGMGTLPFGAPAIIVDAAARIDRGPAFVRAVESLRMTPWLEAARRIVAGDWLGAVEIYEAMPSPADASLVRLRAAGALAAEGRSAEADGVLRPAVDWFRRAGATRYLREAARILDPA